MEALKKVHDQLMEEAEIIPRKKSVKNIGECSQAFPPEHLGITFNFDKL